MLSSHNGLHMYLSYVLIALWPSNDENKDCLPSLAFQVTAFYDVDERKIGKSIGLAVKRGKRLISSKEESLGAATSMSVGGPIRIPVHHWTAPNKPFLVLCVKYMITGNVVHANSQECCVWHACDSGETKGNCRFFFHYDE